MERDYRSSSLDTVMVSVCILNWNCLDTLRKTISLLNSDVKVPFEVIVYDQSSTDGSREFLQGLCHVRTVFGEKNVGNCVSRNVMAGMARHKYVLLLDSDIVPIRGSVDAMASFMERSGNCAFVGYDFRSHSTIWEEVTEEETGIKNSDVRVMGVNYGYKIALTQYGMFKKNTLVDCPFPEFAPFDDAGWGAEDDILGQAITHNMGRLGFGCIILGRKYFHNKGSSVGMLGGKFARAYLKRYSCLKYFECFLAGPAQAEALKSQVLPYKRMPWNLHATGGMEILVKENMPFLEFDKLERDRLLILGGELFGSIREARSELGCDFTKIIAVGSSVERAELHEEMERLKGVSIRLLPSCLEEKKSLIGLIPCGSPCGDLNKMRESMGSENLDLNQFRDDSKRFAESLLKTLRMLS